MKKQLRIVALILIASMLCIGLASCGKKLSGEYMLGSDMFGTGVVLEFKGNKVTIIIKAIGAQVASVEGKYSIDDDQITLAFESDDEDVKKYNGTFDFEETEDGIKIGTFGSFKKQSDK